MSGKSKIWNYQSMRGLVQRLRSDLKDKDFVLLYAYNGTGKTRLSMAFKDDGKKKDTRDTLYFNAFTEDLFTWDNDLDSDSDRVLKINSSSSFFSGIEELEMENRIRPFLQRYADFYFSINYEQGTISFSREIQGTTIDNIKVSRGEENIFIWCFFLAIVQLAIDGAEAYSWVKYIYIDDPISSLDENNAIAVANHLAQLLKKQNSQLKTVISSHHTLFFNVLCNELNTAKKYFLSCNKQSAGYVLKNTSDTPFFHHVAMLTELYQASKSGKLYTYHFNILRNLLEKSASFHGYPNFSACIKQDDDDPDGILHARLINILSHGNYSLYEPQEMLEDNKIYFQKILKDFLNRYRFNPEIFPEPFEEVEES
ncbi:AAA family ATPase [Leptolyngbya ohadii]|uniref:AAA family ATPase n=1 Tax=Leptolyngbya ohadii TaxID=1962290 RepID=UPI000B59E87B|nr:AAA family ATPase [Leptolyngbya ohadii]